MTYRIDAPVDAVQPSAASAVVDRVRPDAQREELRSRDDTVLARRKRSDPLVGVRRVKLAAYRAAGMAHRSGPRSIEMRCVELAVHGAVEMERRLGFADHGRTLTRTLRRFDTRS